MQCISKSESTILSLKWQEKLIFVKAKDMNIYILYLLRTLILRLLRRDLHALLRIVYLCLDGEIQTNLFITPAGFKKQELVPHFWKKIIYQITGHQRLQNLFF